MVFNFMDREKIINYLIDVLGYSEDELLSITSEELTDEELWALVDDPKDFFEFIK